MAATEQSLQAIICKLLLQIQMYRKKSTRSSVHQSNFMLLYVLFISFPVRHKDNLRFDGRHCIGDLNGTYHDLEMFVQWMWQIGFFPHVNQSFKRKQQNFS